MYRIDEIIGIWTRLTHGRDPSVLLVTLAVAVTATLDCLVRLSRARTARRLRLAAAAYAEREIAKEPERRLIAASRLSASGVSA